MIHVVDLIVILVSVIHVFDLIIVLISVILVVDLIMILISVIHVVDPSYNPNFSDTPTDIEPDT